MHRRALAQHHLRHQPEQRREQQLARVLTRALLLELGIERPGTDHTLDQRPCHHRYRRLFNEARQDRRQAQHRGGLGGSREERADLQQVGGHLESHAGKRLRGKQCQHQQVQVMYGVFIGWEDAFALGDRCKWKRTCFQKQYQSHWCISL